MVLTSPVQTYHLFAEILYVLNKFIKSNGENKLPKCREMFYMYLLILVLYIYICWCILKILLLQLNAITQKISDCPLAIAFWKSKQNSIWSLRTLNKNSRLLAEYCPQCINTWGKNFVTEIFYFLNLTIKKKYNKMKTKVSRAILASLLRI